MTDIHELVPICGGNRRSFFEKFIRKARASSMTQKVKRDTMRDLCDGVTCGAGGGVGGTAAGRLVALAATSALPVTPALAVVPLRAFSVNGMPFGGSGSGRFETGGTS